MAHFRSDAYNPACVPKQTKKNIIYETYLYLLSTIKNGVIMPRPTKLTHEVQQKIGENVSLGLTYSLAAAAAGVTYQSLNSWMQRGRTEESGKYYNLYKYIQTCNADAAKVLLERLKKAADAGNCQACMWILERRFSEDFRRRVYKETNVVSENQNVIVDIAINDADCIRAQILEKFVRVKK
jgi:hypothetical protein